MVERDISIMSTALESYQKGYNKYYKPCIDHYKRSLHDRQQLFAYYSEQLKNARTATNVSKSAMRSAVNYASFFLSCVSDMDHIAIGRNDVPIIYNTWSSLEFSECENYLDELQYFFANFDSFYNRPNQVLSRIFDVIATIIPLLSECIFAYESILKKMAARITNVQDQINQTKLEISMLDLDLDQILHEEIIQLETYFLAFKNAIIRFRNLDITQYELGEHFDQTSISQYEMLLHYIESKISKKGTVCSAYICMVCRD